MEDKRGNVKLGRNEQRQVVSTKIINGEYTVDDARKQLEAIYDDAPAVYKSFGETVEDIMVTLGITKKWAGKTILDTTKAEQLTGLNKDIFRKNMYKRDCVVDMALVISICIGFQLSDHYTGWLLNAAGLHFRLDNPDHLAYIFLLDYCRDMTINECNEVLEKVGVRKSRQLGSHPRGLNGEPAEYNPRKTK